MRFNDDLQIVGDATDFFTGLSTKKSLVFVESINGTEGVARPSKYRQPPVAVNALRPRTAVACPLDTLGTPVLHRADP
jgi:hypothetical protein